MVLISACLCSFGKFPVFLFALVAPWVSRRYYDQTVFFQQFLHTDCGNLLDVRSSWQLHFLLTLGQKWSNSHFRAAARNILKPLFVNHETSWNRFHFGFDVFWGKYGWELWLILDIHFQRVAAMTEMWSMKPSSAVVIDLHMYICMYTIYHISTYCTAINYKMQCHLPNAFATFACEALGASCSSSISPSSWTQSFRKKLLTELWFSASRSQRWDMLFCSSIRTPSKREDSCRAEIALGLTRDRVDIRTELQRKYVCKCHWGFCGHIPVISCMESAKKRTQHLRTSQTPRRVLRHNELAQFKIQRVPWT